MAITDRASILKKIEHDMLSDMDNRNVPSRFREMYPDSWLFKKRKRGVTQLAKVYLGSPNFDRFTANEDF